MARLDHAKLAVEDWRASRDWYARNIGLKVEFEAPQGGLEKLGVAALQDEAGLALFVEQVRGKVSPCSCVHNFQVSDVDAKYRELSAAGVRFLSAPKKQYWGYGAELTDPDGHIIYLWDEKSMREKGGAS